MTKRMILRNLACGASAATAMIALAAPVAAVAQDLVHQFNIPAQDLGAALRAFGQASGQQIMFSGADVRGKASAALVGGYSAEEGLRRLLDGTGLRFSRSRTGVLVIGDAPGEGEAGGAAADSGSAWSHAALAEDETIFVTGTHIRGASPTGSRMIEVTRDAIERSGYGRIEDVLAQVPANFAGNNELNPLAASLNLKSANTTLGNEVQLRGLGPGTTLTLVNGVRLPAGGTQGAMTDISLIPVAAIERVEILADGASAIYGSDAVAGVVNFILRRDYEGFETRLRIAQGSGGPRDYQLAQTAGVRWSSGNIVVGYQYNRRGELEAADRPRTALGLDYTSLGGRSFQTFPFASNPGTILNAAGQPAFAIPEGQNGRGLTAAQLRAGSNLADYVSNTWVLPRQDMHSIFLSASQEIGSNVTLSAFGVFSDREFLSLAGTFKNTVQVPSTNPFYVNPFGGTAPVRVSFDFGDDLGPITRSGSVTRYMGALGLEVRLPRNWELNLTASGGREHGTSTFFNLSAISRLNTGVRLTDPLTALNLFGDGANNNPATIATLRTDQRQQGTSEIYAAGAVADGPLFDLPGGAVRLAIGGDFRTERLHAISNVPTLTDERDWRDVSALFAEVIVPIVGPGTEGGRPRLQVSLAARHERYSDFGGTTNPKLGLSWIATPWLTVRGNWGRSFRAPQFNQTNAAFLPTSAFSNILADPQSPTGTSKVLILSGNNADLQPETATTWSAGIDLMPTDRIRLSLSYFDVRYRDKIAALTNGSTVLQREAEWAPIITRNPTAAQIAAVCGLTSFTGDCSAPIAAIIDGRQLNLAEVRVSGVDAELSASTPTSLGRFSVAANATYMIDYEQALSETAPLFSSLNIVGFPVRFRMNGNLAWSSGGWSAGASANFTGRYRNPGTTPDRVGSYTTVNANLGYRWRDGAGWLSNTRLTLAAVNLFDAEPPFVNQSAGYDPANASILGRVLSLSITKEW